MQEYVNLKECTLLVMGGGGVGKTHLISLLLNMRLPSKLSTPCIKAPLCLLETVQDQKGTTTFKLITEEIYTAMMMNLESIPGSILISIDDFRLSSHDKDKNPSTFQLPISNEVGRYLLKVKSKMSSETLDGKILGRIIDTGGQPQLCELLPRFIRGISFFTIVIDLSQSFNKYSYSCFYGEDGQSVGNRVCSNLTNEQISRSFLQMIASQSTEQKKVKFIIVGTHEDGEKSSIEPRSRKEDVLKNIIASFGLEKSVIYANKSLADLIFAVNARNPRDKDRAIGKMIMEIMMNEKDAVEVSIPKKHHILASVIKMLTKSKRVAIPFHEVFSYMILYYESQETMTEGLQFLNNSFRIFYFIEFPEHVFGEPQLLLNLMTNITACHIMLLANSEQRPAYGVWKQFKEQGIINEYILQETSDNYDDVFTPKHMLKVMEKLLIICNVGNGEYMMPSLLTSKASVPRSMFKLLSSGNNYLHRLVSSMNSDITMLLHFPISPSPFGVYCGTVCELISGCMWKVRGQNSRNKICFTQTNTPGIISLIDSFDSFFIVNLDVSSDFEPKLLSSMCTHIRETICRVIKKVMTELRYVASDPVVAFLCKHDGSPPHVAEYLPENNSLRCIKDKDVNIEVDDKHLLWLQDMCPGSVHY